MIIINMKEWKQGCVILPSGMHGQSFFPSGWGGTGHRVKSLEQGRVTVKLGAFLGRGGAVLKIFGAGTRASIPNYSMYSIENILD